MRPLRLEMQGFSAFADRTEVDFTDVELAALVGPTGAGKSSIIDAITFALYGAVARYDEKLVAPVVNQLCNEARVRLEFELDGTTYTAVRVVRRTKTGGGSTKEARLESGGEVLAADAKSMTEQIEKLFGLDFAQFNKTVVLPQGRFADFLHDKPSARGALLRELLGLGVYSRVGVMARELAKSRDEHANVLERSVVEAGADVTPERLEALRARVQRIGAAQDEVGVAVPALVELSERSANARSELASSESSLALVGAVVMPEGVAELDAELQAAVTLLATATVERDAAGVAVAEAETAAGQHPSVAECDRLLELHRRRDAAAAGLTEARDALERHIAVLLAATERANTVRAELGGLVDAVRARKAAADAAEESLRGLGESAPLVAALAGFDQLAKLGPELEAAVSREREAAQAQAAAQEAQRAAEVLLTEAERLAPAAALAAHLHEGDACPVCQQVVAQLPTHIGSVESELAALKVDVNTRREERGHADQAHRRIEQVLTAVRTRHDETVARLAGQPEPAVIEARLAEIERGRTASDSMREKLREAESARATYEDAVSTKQAYVDEDEAKSQHAAAVAVVATCERQLAEALQSAASAPSVEEVRSQRLRSFELAAVLEQARAAQRTAGEAHRRAEQARGACAEREDAARERFSETRDSVAVLGPPRAPKGLADAWQQLAAWAAGVAAQLQQRVRQLQEEAAAAEAARAAGLAALGERISEFVDEPVRSMEQITNLLAVAHATTVGDIVHVEKELARIDAARREVDTLREEAQVAHTLGQVLKADRFERWLLAEAMEDLVERATARLRELTAGQYSLTTDDSAFKIVDHRNADEVRDARSLSGGETFLASLALALALADSTMELAAAGSATLESIFLDEGFGSLDPDTLDVVAASIDELGASGRMVVIVTHIRELAERMPTRFEVTKGAGSSSVVRVEA